MFEKLRRTVRVVLHRNLLIAICIRNFFDKFVKGAGYIRCLEIPESKAIRLGVEFWLFSKEQRKNAIYACMLVDGYYLHKVIVRSFAKDAPVYYLYITVAVLTVVPTLIWAITLGATNTENCWMVDTDGFQWINDGFRITILTINTLLLLDIIRVMLMKMKHGSTTRQTKAAFRATLFLIPLFGIHIIVTAKKIVFDDSCLAEDFYEFTRYSMEALQGIFVATLFCYANSEVHNEVSNGYRKLAIYLNQKFGWNIRRETLYRRRTTTATYVQSSSC
ncbi:hypothetical protein NQ317_010534 [Molorchus minor]|uniref:G-protein coupled receptors family 2 profile 2 domain-containing protein n=1 Tax=Molorchus minor TaxID=1323400 RepID=A0ABQ9JYU9_9CUCU|nr:hypothetical protein NQ317_010534 [Molorchus minor]